MNLLLFSIALPLLAYLLGSVPFGLLITRIGTGQDIRKAGSGNIGATNVKRLMGTRWGVMTLALDISKGAIPTWAALCLSAGEASWLVGATMLAAVCGPYVPSIPQIPTERQGSGNGRRLHPGYSAAGLNRRPDDLHRHGSLDPKDFGRFSERNSGIAPRSLVQHPEPGPPCTQPDHNGPYPPSA
jgi:hypothetical protein